MDKKYAITISHQLGCGGAIIGESLSKVLSIPFIDRQILKKAANYLNLSEESIESREEKISSFWNILFREEALSEPMTAIAEDYIPSDKELYELEKQYIETIANKNSCIILGRGANYILRNHPRHLRVFIGAEMKERIQRVSKLYNVSEHESCKIIEKNDTSRNAYIKTYTGLDILNVKSYDICINTSSMGLEHSVTIIESALKSKIGSF